jgi:hypothetical protein
MRGGRADDDASEIVALQPGKFGDLVLRGHHRLGTAAIEPILQFIRCQQCRRRDHHDPELDRGQHRLPERHDIAEQQQQVVAALDALCAQKVRDLVGAARQFGE